MLKNTATRRRARCPPYVGLAGPPGVGGHHRDLARHPLDVLPVLDVTVLVREHPRLGGLQVGVFPLGQLGQLARACSLSGPSR